MTVTFVSSPVQTRDTRSLDPELTLITRLTQAAAEVGIQTDPVSIVNLYVALKSKPLAILTGIAQSGKIALVRILAQALIGDDPFRCQMMTGHAWWAGQTGNVALFTDMQTRLNSDKILNLIEEAGRPENARRVYIACLTRISPAELIGFFSELACQLRLGQIMQLPSIHLTEPIAYPSNLLLIGTMDAERFDWDDADLLAKTTIVRWSAVETKPPVAGCKPATTLDDGSEFLSSRVGNEGFARAKLVRFLKWDARCIQLIYQVRDLLQAHQVSLTDSVLGEAVVYFANAWSKRGVGLFHSTNTRNAAIALDLALAHTVLPRAKQAIHASATLKDQLRVALEASPYSMAILDALN